VFLLDAIAKSANTPEFLVRVLLFVDDMLIAASDLATGIVLSIKAKVLA
jgi:hypothetical protein